MKKTSDIINAAVAAKSSMNGYDETIKNKAIDLMAESLLNDTNRILSENKKDIEAARGHISDVMLDRLMLNKERIEAMARGMIDVRKLDDPKGKVVSAINRPNGLCIQKTLVPMGVIAIIYESRPNVTSDAAVLCFKSSNVCILRGGREAYNTSKAIVDALRFGLEKCGIDPDVIQLVEDTDHQSANELMRAKGSVDLLIPRGGKNLIRACVENALVPCIETGTGICHVYVEKSADLEMALNIIENAKTSRPSVCNAAEVLLVDEDIAGSFLPMLAKRLRDDRIAPAGNDNGDNAGSIKTLIPVELILDERAHMIIDGTKADDDSFDTEYLDYKLAVGIVNGYEDAVEHIKKHSTGHSEAIVTRSKEAEEYFVNNVDSAAVYVNASTRFTDGSEFGLGCEMGISTQKMHARGPMGLEELMSYHYVIRGNGQVR